MKLTVAVCTWNRAPLLERTLASLFAMQRPRAEWELIVVDNNSTDDTPATLARWTTRLPLRVVTERKQGLSHARNAAIDAASGDYILWTDDDVQVSDRWLLAYERAIERHPAVAIFGGPIRPWFEHEPPAWLRAWMPEVESAFACRDFGSQERPLHPTECIPFGANFALRMAEQRSHRFDPSLGRVKEGGTLGEETTVMRALLRAGSTGIWVPDAPVQHWVPAERMSLDYLGTYYRMYGKTLFQWGQRPAGQALAGVPLWLWRKQAAQWWRYRRLRSTQPNSRACAAAFVDWNETLGLLEAVRNGQRDG